MYLAEKQQTPILNYFIRSYTVQGVVFMIYDNANNNTVTVHV